MLFLLTAIQRVLVEKRPNNNGLKKVSLESHDRPFLQNLGLTSADN